MFFELNFAPSRGLSLKSVKPRCRLDVRNFSLAHRVVEVWNSLDDKVIACDSLNGFKNRLDKFMHGRGFYISLYELSSLVNYYTRLDYSTLHYTILNCTIHVLSCPVIFRTVWSCQMWPVMSSHLLMGPISNIILLKLLMIMNISAKKVTWITLLDLSADLIILFCERHWLPVEHRISFKIVVMIYKCVHSVTADYLAD